MNAICRSKQLKVKVAQERKNKEDRDDLRSENCSIDMIRVEEDQLVLLELGP